VAAKRLKDCEQLVANEQKARRSLEKKVQRLSRDLAVEKARAEVLVSQSKDLLSVGALESIVRQSLDANVSNPSSI
jgi:hypothetical protein